MSGWRKRQVLEMAREAGIDVWLESGQDDDLFMVTKDSLKNFAELVRADERERIKEENQRCYAAKGQA